MAKRIANPVTAVSEALRPNCAVLRGFVVAPPPVDMNEPSFGRKRRRTNAELSNLRRAHCVFVLLP